MDELRARMKECERELDQATHQIYIETTLAIRCGYKTPTENMRLSLIHI